MSKVESVLKLNRLVFDKIEFERKGFKNNNNVEFTFRIGTAIIEGSNVVKLNLTGDKKDEYSFNIALSGYFSFNPDESVVKEDAEILLNKNAVAIMLPYLRSQVSLLTAQPETDCVVLPPFNINRLLESKPKD